MVSELQEASSVYSAQGGDPVFPLHSGLVESCTQALQISLYFVISEDSLPLSSAIFWFISHNMAVGVPWSEHSGAVQEDSTQVLHKFILSVKPANNALQSRGGSWDSMCMY